MHSPALQMYYSIMHYICSAINLHAAYPKTLITPALLPLFESIIAKNVGTWHHMNMNKFIHRSALLHLTC